MLTDRGLQYMKLKDSSLFVFEISIPLEILISCCIFSLKKFFHIDLYFSLLRTYQLECNPGFLELYSFLHFWCPTQLSLDMRSFIVR